MSSDTSRITVRLPARDVDLVDALVDAGEYTTRTAVIRRAIRDFLQREGPKMAESVQSEKALTEALLQMQSMQEQLNKQRELLEKFMQK